MLSPEDNALVTGVGPGTPGGDLMRRYWQPFTGSSEIRKRKVMSVRLLGEDLVLFIDKSGNLGLVDAFCAHRRLRLGVGYPVENGIRCPYHSWTYDAKGRCIAQPGEPANSRMKDHVKIKSYPVQELGGMVFAYLGPEPAPLLPRWDYLVDDRMLRQIGFVIAPYNWLQGMENSYDAVHAEMLHGNYFKHVLDEAGDPNDPRYDVTVNAFTTPHQEVRYDRADYGFLRRVILEGQSETADTFKVGHAKMFPNITTINAGGTCTSTYQVPIDETHTLYIGHRGYKFPEWVEVPEQKSENVPWFPIPTHDADGNWIQDDIVAQDIMVMTQQGPILDRSLEVLGQTDVGIVQFRRLLKEQILAVQDGQDPINTYRDNAANRRLELPHSKNFYDRGVFGDTRAFSYRRGSATGSLGLQNSPINDVIEDLYVKAAELSPPSCGRVSVRQEAARAC